MADTPNSTNSPNVSSTTDTPQDAGAIDRLTGTSAEDRKALFSDAQEKIGGVLSSAIDAVKNNPKTAAAIAAGATAAVAGAAYGATTLAKGSNARNSGSDKSNNKK